MHGPSPTSNFWMGTVSPVPQVSAPAFLHHSFSIVFGFAILLHSCTSKFITTTAQLPFYKCKLHFITADIVISCELKYALRFTITTLHKFTFPASANYAYWRFYMVLMDNAEKAGICTLRWIPTLPDRFHPRKCPVGYIPRLMSNVNYCGFETPASTLIPTSGQSGFKA